MYYIAVKNPDKGNYSIETAVENWHDAVDGFEPIDCIKGMVVIYDEQGHKYLVGPDKDLKEYKLFGKTSSVDVGSWDFEKGEPFLIDTNKVVPGELKKLLKNFKQNTAFMNDKIAPRLHRIFFYGEPRKGEGFESATMPIYDGGDWHIEGGFYVKDELTENYNKTKPFYRRHRGNKDGGLGHVFPFMICNPGYLKKHRKELEANGDKPILMEKFDAESASKLIANKIKQAGDNINIDKLWGHLSSFADTEYDSWPPKQSNTVGQE